MKAIKHKILVLSGKGGVGKSTFAAQLAFALAASGKDVSASRFGKRGQQLAICSAPPLLDCFLLCERQLGLPSLG